jgi:hypothetical protein
MKRVIEKIAALGAPGLILLVVMSTNSLAGGAAITAALAFLGGPFGMLGGIGTLIIISLTADSLAKHGLEKIFAESVNKMIEDGKSKDDIKKDLKNFPIPSGTKDKIINLLDKEPEPTEEESTDECEEDSNDS